MSNQSLHEIEAGVVVIDKVRHLLGVLTIAKMNSDREREILYNMTYGDKESFLLGTLVAMEPFSLSPHLPGVVGVWQDGKRERERERQREDEEREREKKKKKKNTNLIKAREREREREKEGEKEKKKSRERENERERERESLVCGQQLVHTDSSGERIFWWNNGMAKDKYAENYNPQKMEIWLTESGSDSFFKGSKWVPVYERGTTQYCLGVKEREREEKGRKIESERERELIADLQREWLKLTPELRKTAAINKREREKKKREREWAKKEEKRKERVRHSQEQQKKRRRK